MRPKSRRKLSDTTWKRVFGTNKVDQSRENFVRSKAFYLLFRDILEPAVFSANLMIPATFERLAADFLRDLQHLFPGYKVAALNPHFVKMGRLQLVITKDDEIWLPSLNYGKNRPLIHLLRHTAKQFNSICVQCGRRKDENSMQYRRCIYCVAKEDARITRKQNGL